LIDKEEYLDIELIKIEANSASPSITSHEFPYSYVYNPIELEAPKSVQNVEIADENSSLNFTSKLEPDSSPNRNRIQVDLQTLSNNLIAYDNTTKYKQDIFTPNRAQRFLNPEIDTEIPHFGQEPIMR